MFRQTKSRNISFLAMSNFKKILLIQKIIIMSNHVYVIWKILDQQNFFKILKLVKYTKRNHRFWVIS